MAGTIHKFEAAGLGKAPFRYVGNERRIFSIPGVPGSAKPGASCDYCGTAIADCYIIQSSDGKQFKVGSTCVHKTGDRGIIDPVKREEARAKRERKHERDDLRIANATDLLTSKVKAALAAEPSPIEWRAERGDTKLDWVEWMFKHAGRRGMVEAARVVEKLFHELKETNQ